LIAGWNSGQTLRAKEILYRCMEDLEATKAALYLRPGGGSFELVTSYGFGRGEELAATITDDHPLVTWVRGRGASVGWLNDAEEAGGLGRYLAGSGSQRLLTIPLTADGLLVGFIDARDKARKIAYGSPDVAAAEAIGHALEELLRAEGMCGLEPRPSRGVRPTRAEGLVDHPLDRSVVESLMATLAPLAGVPGIAALALAVGDAATARTVLLGGAALDRKQRDAVARHQVDQLAAARVPRPSAKQWTWAERGGGGGEVRCETIHTMVLHEGPPAWVVASVLAPAGSTAWSAVLTAAAQQVRAARALRDYRLAARNLARILLEPGETSYPHLRQHSQAVSELSQRLAAALALSAEDEELVTLAAYLHDVGMRELEYSRIYRMTAPGDRERRLYQRHSTVGARIVESAAYPGDLAGAIRHHHERWDGTGYPARLAGRSIPRASRIIHLTEVYDTLTSRSSYRPPMSRETALAAIRAEAGAQFDPELVPVFEKLVGA
jgi:putative nucleotidyltransferase with HDIG domain